MVFTAVPSSLSPSPFGALFSTYDLDASYDEMFDPAGFARAHCQPLFDELRAASNVDLSQRQMEADKAFLTQGITFTVYGDNQGTGASFRIVADPQDWDRSVGTNSPGQSGDPASPHFQDLFAPWAEGRYFPAMYSRPKVESVTESKTLLLPAQKKM